MIRGRYEVRERLGHGGQGDFYCVYDREARKHRGMKAAFGQENIDALRREAAVLEKLRHPKIPSLFQVFPWRGGFCAVMELMPGKPLDAGRTAGEEELLRLGISLCRVLEYLHGREPPILYLDLKPENILVERGRLTALVDFGCAREMGKDCRTGRAMFGTREYAAPEQFRPGGILTEGTDLYALGRLLKKMAGGRLRGSGAEQVWNRCCEGAAPGRYASAAEVRRELRQCRRRAQGGFCRRARTFRRRHPEAAAAAVLAGAVLAVLAAAAAWREWRYRECREALLSLLEPPFGEEEEEEYRRRQYEDVGGEARIVVLASRGEAYGEFLYETALRYWYGYTGADGQWKALGRLEQAVRYPLPAGMAERAEAYLALKPYYAWRRGETQMEGEDWERTQKAWEELLDDREEALLQGVERLEQLEEQYLQFQEERAREERVD